MSAREWDPVSAVAGHFPELPSIPRYDPAVRPVPRFAHMDHGISKPRRGGRGDYGTKTPVDGRKRCPQCWAIKDFPKRFEGKQNCNECRAKMSTQTPRGPRS